MELNEKQTEALKKMFEGNPNGSPDFEHFKGRCFPLIGEPKVAMIGYCGMTVGIEEDGYVHS